MCYIKKDICFQISPCILCKMLSKLRFRGAERDGTFTFWALPYTSKDRFSAFFALCSAIIDWNVANKTAYFLILHLQGQEVGKKSHDIRMLCIEKEIEFARSQAVSFAGFFVLFVCSVFSKCKQSLMCCSRKDPHTPRKFWNLRLASYFRSKISLLRSIPHSVEYSSPLSVHIAALTRHSFSQLLYYYFILPTDQERETASYAV